MTYRASRPDLGLIVFVSVFLRRLDKGSVPVLRRVGTIDVPDPDSKEPAMGDLLDAMVVGMHAIRSRTLKK